MQSLKFVPLLLLSCSIGVDTVASAEPAASKRELLTASDAVVGNSALPTLKSLESNLLVTAQSAPKELRIDQHVNWQQHKHSEADSPTLEFTSGQPKTMTVELMFDMFEKGDVHKEYIAQIEKLATIDEAKKRPPLVVFTWGSTTFQGVIEDLNVRFTLFMPDGTPCRATVGFHMQQATSVMNRREAEEANRREPKSECVTDSDCEKGEVCTKSRCVAAVSGAQP